MRETKRRALFRRDFKRNFRGIYRNLLEEGGEFDQIRLLLENDIPLPVRYRDHQLHGDWEGCRECHIRPNLLLVYRYAGDYGLILERLGSHSEIFGI